jgi:hypothetical protein
LVAYELIHEWHGNPKCYSFTKENINLLEFRVLDKPVSYLLVMDRSEDRMANVTGYQNF